jgi:protein-disulfide isomerase
LLLLALGCSSGLNYVNVDPSPRLGPKGAADEIVVFSDFQCAFCKRAARELGQIHRANPNRVVIYFKHFPISRHKQSLNAAHAAEAARLQGKFWEMHDQLFAHAGELTDGSYKALAEKLGLDVERFLKDMSSEQVANRVLSDRLEGEGIGIRGTPFFLINRRPYRGSVSEIAGGLGVSSAYREY